MKTTETLAISVLALGVMVCQANVIEAATPMGTAFTYQERLMDADQPLEGLYDLQFKLFDDPDLILGVQVGSTIDIGELIIMDGQITVELDFGSGVFDGDARWLEIGVRPWESVDPEVYTVLLPRVELKPVPYALHTRWLFLGDQYATNMFVGRNAGHSNTTGGQNTFVGKAAGYSNTEGHHNTFVGYRAGTYNTTGSHNTFVGDEVGRSNTTGKDNTFLGFYAGHSNTTGDDSTFVGEMAGRNTTTGGSNTFLGSKAGFWNSTGHANTFVGCQAGLQNDTGEYNTFLGFYAGHSNTTGNANTFVGRHTGHLNTTGYENTFVGNTAGHSNTTGAFNTFVGYRAGLQNTTGNYNTFAGYKAGRSNTTGNANIFLGFHAGYHNTTGEHNTFVGNWAGYTNIDGHQNTFLGDGAGSYIVDGNANTFVGDNAGSRNIDGDRNTFVGVWTGGENFTGSGNVFIGYEAGGNETGSNKLYIANSGSIPLIYGDFSTGGVGISTTNPGSYKLAVNGSAAKPGGGSWSNFSDIRLKKLDGNYERGLSELSKLTPIRYSYKEDNELELPTDKEFVGVVSQEVQTIIPEAVEENSDGYLMVNNDPIIWAMVNAIKELKAENDLLRQRLAALEKIVREQNVATAR